MSDIEAIDNETLAIVVSEALRAHVGPRKRYSYEEAAGAVGVRVRTMTSWVLGQTPPQSYKLIRLFRWLGADFANEVMGMAGLHTVPVDPPAGGELSLNKDTAALVHELADALEDGTIDHIERRRILRKAKALMPQLSSYLSANEPHINVVAAAE